MHWYVLEKYHSQLAKLSKSGGGRTSPPLPSTEDQLGGANEEEEEEDPSRPLSLVPINNRKWLKGVALKKVQVGAKKSSSDFVEVALPYLSVFERDGLLALIHEMLKSDLFIPDAPPTYPNPKQLLEELKEQLQCSSVEKMCAPRPTGVGLVPAAPEDRGSGRVSRGKSGTGTPRKRGRKVCGEDDESKGVKVQKKDTQTSKRKVTSKRKRKPLLVSVPKSLMKGSLDGEREEKILSDGSSRDDGKMSLGEVAVTDNIELAADKVEQGVAKDKENIKVVGHESEHVALTREILTPPMSLSSAASISPSPSPSPLPPSSPVTPSSHPFTLKLELDSPLSSSATPVSQTTTLHSLSQQIHQNSFETLNMSTDLLGATSESLTE